MTDEIDKPKGRNVLTLPSLEARRKAVGRSVVDAEIKALCIRYDDRIASQPPPPVLPEGWTQQDLIRYEVALLEAHIADYVPEPEDASDRSD